jgi:hypothetical protein
MLTIRKEQFAVFQKVACDDFENRMVSHIKEFFPQQAEHLGEAGIRDLIRYGIQRAATYQFELEPDVCNYIDFMLVFGRDFDRDPALSWASCILNDPALPKPAVRVRELHKAAAALQSSQGGE